MIITQSKHRLTAYIWLRLRYPSEPPPILLLLVVTSDIREHYVQSASARLKKGLISMIHSMN